ncbi:MAG: endonuclease [Caulobacter sp.]|nr:endonuclease [Caulobacter sp.]
MGKLSAMPGRLSAMPQRLARPRDPDGHSAEAEPWRAWYNLKRWKLLRIATFVRDLFTCQMPDCRRIETDTALLVCDHVERHNGDPRLFWDERNLQTLCKPCHDKTKQAQERRARVGPA